MQEGITWKCLLKLNKDELKETLNEIQSGMVYDSDGWDDVYADNESIIGYIKQNYPELLKKYNLDEKADIEKYQESINRKDMCI